MPAAPAVPSPQTAPAPLANASSVASTRLTSLDLFRGVTIAAMILVNDPGNDHSYWPLEHADWNGWTPTDLIFPFFLFIVGVSLVFSFESRLQRGDSKGVLLLHTIRRAAIIFAIGLAMNYSLVLLAPSIFTQVTNSRSSAAHRSLLPRGLHPVPLYPSPHPGRRRCRAAHRLLDPDAIRSRAGFRCSRPRHPIPSSGRESRGLSGSQGLHPSLGDHSRSRGTAEHPSRHRHAAPRSLHRRMAAIQTQPANQSSRNAPVRRGRSDSWQNLGHLVPHQQETLDEFLRALHRGTRAGLPGPLLLVHGYQTLGRNPIQRNWTKPFLIFGRNAITAYIVAWFVAVSLFLLHAPLDGKMRSGHDYIFTRFFAPLGSPSFTSLLFAIAFVLTMPAPHLAHGSQENIPEDLKRRSFGKQTG